MKKFIVGFLVGVLLILPIPSLADSSLIGLTVQNTLPLFIDGEKTNNDLILVNGKSYLPIREAGELLGFEVKYEDGTVYLNKNQNNNNLSSSSDNNNDSTNGTSDLNDSNTSSTIDNSGLEIVDPRYNYDQKLDFVPYDVKFDKENGFIYMIDKSTKSLVKYSIADKKFTSVQFDYIPERIHVTDGKVYVTLTIQGHSSYYWDEDQEGYIGIVDAKSMNIIKTMFIELDPYDVVAKDGYIYVSGGSGQWTEIRSYSEKTGLQVDTRTIYEECPIELHPEGDRIYSITTGLSPRDMEVFHIDKGKFVTSYDSPYHGDYHMAIGFTISPDGKYIFNNSGVIFKTGYSSGSDMTYYKRFNQSFNSVAFDIKNNRIYINVGEKGIIGVFDYETLEGLSSFKTLTSVDFMEVIGENLVTVEHEDGNSGINFIKLNN